MEHFDLVQKAYNELRASNDIVPVPPGPNQERTVEEQKAYLTRRAAWYLHQVDNSYGLLAKTTGNNVMGLSVDITIKKPSGEFFDIATDREVEPNSRMAFPVNSGGSVDPALVPRWVQPTAALAGLPDNGNGEEPPDDDEIMEKLDEIQGQLQVVLNKQNETLAAIAAQNQVLAEHTAMLQLLLDKPSDGGGKFPITYPNYAGRVLGFTVTLQPEPRQNP